jgi:hypothetical protein
MIYRTLLQFSFNLFPTIFDVCGDDVTALQYAARPGITRTSVWSSKLAFRVIEVLMEDFSIGLDRDASSPLKREQLSTYHLQGAESYTTPRQKHRPD